MSTDTIDDRTSLSSMQLYRLASLGEIDLRQSEKERISPDLLFLLAITNKLRLNQRDRNNLRPIHLAHLAVLDKIELTHADKARLPTELLFELFVDGRTDLSVDEMAHFTDNQLDYIERLETVCVAVA